MRKVCLLPLQTVPWHTAKQPDSNNVSTHKHTPTHIQTNTKFEEDSEEKARICGHTCTTWEGIG